MEFFSSLPQLFHRGDCADMLRNARSQQKRSFSDKDSYRKTSRITKKGQKRLKHKWPSEALLCLELGFRKLNCADIITILLYFQILQALEQKETPVQADYERKIIFNKFMWTSGPSWSKAYYPANTYLGNQLAYSLGREFILWKALSTFWTTGASMLTTLTSNEIE